MTDLDVFLAPLDGASPSGAELRNDPQFLAVQRLLDPAARAARIEAPGEPPSVTAQVDWGDVLDRAKELATTGRDLRLLVIVTRALANEGGIDPQTGYTGYAGLARGLEMLARNIDEFWDSLHPELRSGPPREAGLRRINALMQLENDDNGLLGDLQMNAVIQPRGIGPVTGEDLSLGALSHNDVLNEAPSGLGAAEQEKITADHAARVHRVEAATRAMAAETPEMFEALSASRAAARTGVDALARAVNDKLGLGPGEGMRFVELSRFLDRVGATLEAARAHIAAESAPAAGQDAAAVPGAPATAAQGFGGEINSREDVERALDQIIAFYERTEPSSPIPHLARRLRRMVPMDFMDLIEELAPGGVKEFRNVAGIDDRKK